jgi:hypothetical protein
VFKKYGEQLGLVGTWWSGQEHRVLSGIDGVLLVIVIGRVLRFVLHLPGDLQRAADNRGDHLQSEALLALCRL